MKMCNVMCVQPKIHYLQAWHNSIKIDKTVILGVIDNKNLRSIYIYIPNIWWFCLWMENSNYYTSIKKEWFGFFDSDLERLLGNEVFLSYSVYFKNCKKVCFTPVNETPRTG